MTKRDETLRECHLSLHLNRQKSGWIRRIGAVSSAGRARPVSRIGELLP